MKPHPPTPSPEKEEGALWWWGRRDFCLIGRRNEKMRLAKSEMQLAKFKIQAAFWASASRIFIFASRIFCHRNFMLCFGGIQPWDDVGLALG